MIKNKNKNKKKRIVPSRTRTSLSTVMFSHPLVIIALVIITLFAAANIQTTKNLTANVQNVLGENEQSEEQKQAEEQQKESAKQEEEQQKEAAKTETTTTNTTENSGSSRS